MALKHIPVPNTIIHNAPPPLVEVQGTHRQMGCQIGEACRQQVQHSIENAHVLIGQSYTTLELTWDGSGPDGKPKPRAPIQLPTGETRLFLQDGDEVIMTAFCERDGVRRIGFGDCRGVIVG